MHFSLLSNVEEVCLILEDINNVPARGVLDDHSPHTPDQPAAKSQSHKIQRAVCETKSSNCGDCSGPEPCVVTRKEHPYCGNLMSRALVFLLYLCRVYREYRVYTFSDQMYHSTMHCIYSFFHKFLGCHPVSK